MGDDIIKEVDDEEERLPTPPPQLGRRTQSMLDEVPPEIPRRTVDRLELVAEDPEPMSLGQYDIVKGEQMENNSMTYDVVQDPKVGNGVYEEPTPCTLYINIMCAACFLCTVCVRKNIPLIPYNSVCIGIGCSPKCRP